MKMEEKINRIINWLFEITNYPIIMIGLHTFYNKTIKTIIWLNKNEKNYLQSMNIIIFLKIHSWHCKKLIKEKRIHEMVI